MRSRNGLVTVVHKFFFKLKIHKKNLQIEFNEISLIIQVLEIVTIYYHEFKGRVEFGA